MIHDVFIKNAVIVTESQHFWGGLVINDGKISQLISNGMQVEANQVIDLEGKHLLPGLVDCHFHFNEPGRTHWEGYLTGSRAAAAAGVTTAMDMPLNCVPATTSVERLAEKRELAQSQTVIDIAHWGGLSGDNLDALEAMNREGVVGFKVFMSETGIEEFKHINDDMLYEGLKLAGKMGAIIGAHAENEAVANYLGKQLQQAGRVDRAAFLASRPPETELEAIRRACFWAGVANGNLHVVHTTIADGIQAIKQAKQEGVNVTVETCPHYLYFNEEDFEIIGPLLKCTPPIRSLDHVEALWQTVLSGEVDIISSDHSPCAYELKKNGMDNIWAAWGGITGVQAMLAVILTEGYHKRGLGLQDIVRMMSANPARRFGLFPQKGSIAPGVDADLIVVDLDREWTLTKDKLLSKNPYSPYLGRTFRGCVEKTLVRGKIVYDMGKIVVEPGYGQIVYRNAS
jgi:allantoinase